MQKGTKKGTHDGIRVVAVKKLAKEFNYTEMYIRQCLRGDSKSLASDEVKKRYGLVYNQIKSALEII
jgi:hypothetical protein